MKKGRKRTLLWECGPVFGCPRVEKTAAGKIVISDTNTKKEIELTVEEFEALKQAIKNGEL